MNDYYAAVWGNSLELRSKETGKALEKLSLVPADENHRNYILSTWVKSYAPFARRLEVSAGVQHVRLNADCYAAGEAMVAERHWRKSIVVVSPEDAYTIHAWICGDTAKINGTPGKLWHVYVPPDLRGKGIARALVEHVSGKVYMVSKPWPRTPKGHMVTYNPYLQGD